MAIIFRSFVLLIAAVFAIQAIRVAMAQDLVRQSQFEEALQWRGGSPEALTRSAQVELGLGDNRGATALAARAVAVTPLNVAAIRIAGLATQLGGDSDGGETIMRQASQIGWLDTPTQLWMLRTAISRGSWVVAAQRADALLRVNPRYTQIINALWIAMAEPEAARAVAIRLQVYPSWRENFFRANRGITPGYEQALGNIAAALRAGQAPMSQGEFRASYANLAALNKYREARLLWLAMQPPQSQKSQALISDGDFNDLLSHETSNHPSTALFGWKASHDRGVNPPRVVSDKLVITAAGSAHPVISQILALSAGSYRLAADIRTKSPEEAYRWLVTCLPSHARLIPQTVGPGLAQFQIPDAQCDGQNIALMVDRPAELHLNSVRLSAMQGGGQVR